MPLKTGVRLGPYEILGTIGAGGMGEVYLARDTNLHRDVAIKVLPDAMAGNPSRLLRFQREARALAALNHPNIAAVYAIEERAIVMELVLGEDLSVRLSRGPMPLIEALSIARQVAEALAAAHDAGIVHRDLKPANIKVRDDGAVKVLDFGLAKEVVSPAADSESRLGSGSDSGDLPLTLTMDPDITADGAVLGTAAYMAPEQAKGKTIDKRADIWAFGAVLFEMLAGCRPFGKGDASDTIARALATEPQWTALPRDTPASIRRLLVRCLAKDRRQRLHDIADARLEIDDAMTPEAAVARRIPWLRAGVLIFVGLLAGVGLARSVWPSTSPAVPVVTYARLDVNPAAEVDAGGIHPSVVLTPGGARTALAWAPDGRTLAFIGVKDGVRRIYLRKLDDEAARPVAGTERAGSFTFSPDGSELAFWADRALHRVRTAGGPVAKICDTGAVNGITWAAKRLIYSQGSLWSVDPTSAAAVPKPVILPPELVRHADPLLLPGGEALLYTEYQKQWTSGDERVMVLPLTPGAGATVLIREAADARYLASGHLAFMRQGTLFVVPFDKETLTLSGEPVPLLKDVSQSSVAWDSDDLTLAGQFTISSQGTLAYLRSPLATYPGLELVAFDRGGRITPLNAPIKGYRNHVEVSPDGLHLAVSLQTATELQLFSYDLVRGGLSRVAESMKGEVFLASWARDNRIAVGVVAEGKVSAAVVRPDGAAIPTPIDDSTGFWPSSLLPDGRLAGMKDGGIWVYDVQSGRKGTPFLSTSATLLQPMWSPDGRWLAYTSNATGRNEVYIRPYPAPGDAIMISTQGGNSPAWNPNGRELFFVQPDTPDRMMAVRFAAPGRPVETDELFSVAASGLVLGSAVFTPYAVAPDGQRFYAVRRPSRSSTSADAIHVIFNWVEEIKKKALSGQ